LPLPERQLIARLRRAAQASPGGFGHRSLIAGMGDDCSILRIPDGREALVTTDFSLEGVHFRREWHPAKSVGHRCLARGLSDIAAMGGEPLAAFLSLAVPAKLPQKWVDDFTAGFLTLAKQFGVVLAGGDTASSPAGVLADVMVVGSVPKGKAILRSGARPGDIIYVTGSLGGAAAALDLLYARAKLKPGVFSSYFFPEPRIKAARVLREKKIATSMIDISDGLSTDLSHICEESGVGAEIQESAIPRATSGSPTRIVDSKSALHGGDDYELLFIARPRTRVPGKIAGVVVTQIGQITRKKGMRLVSGNGSVAELKARGWEHFGAVSTR
jgi:thiamine-monophosphate kinase